MSASIFFENAITHKRASISRARQPRSKRPCIRTLQQGKKGHTQAGVGIVADSGPEKEFEEIGKQIPRNSKSHRKS
ncbi:chorismate-binding protein [Alloacidobacterium dinghuense]|uniref:Chorismate-binding protein n=1 Tax=Alloacidobacterium dinghuense TaxID=2763107 RepID=A0A7G8BQD1_9BACT|nr:chorismate-binding protein [Alloacidobacterium dinghuense]